MAQASGSHFKLVYQDWIDVRGNKYPAPNTLHPIVVKNLEFNANRDGYNTGALKAPFFEPEFQRNDSGYYFRHSNFISFFTKHRGIENVVSLEQVDSAIDCEYLYPIEIEWSGLELLKSPSIFKHNGVDIHYSFKDVLNKQVLSLVNQGKLKIVVNNIIDPSVSLGYLEEVKSSLNDAGIPSTQIVFLFGNTPRGFLLDGHAAEYQICNATLSLQQASKVINSFPQYNRELQYENDNVKESDLDSSIVRNKKFICFNRTMNRPHRIAMAYLAVKNDLLGVGTFSFLTFLGERSEVIRRLEELIPDDDVEAIADKIISMVPYEIDTHHLSMQEKEAFQTVNTNLKELYIDSYFHIVSETQFDTAPYPFFSEKTWRPMINLQPFIHVGNHGALRVIKQLGFKTFDKWIDESYDIEIDPFKRFQLIRKEIERLNRMDIKEIHAMYYEMRDILIHNQNLIKTFEDYDPLQELFDGI